MVTEEQRGKQIAEQIIVVLVTAPNAETATGLAGALVGKQLAACVNILPTVQSVYRWQGKVEQAMEHLLLIKSTAAQYSALETEILRLHPYDTPEVLALNAAAVSPQYAAWVLNEVSR